MINSTASTPKMKATSLSPSSAILCDILVNPVNHIVTYYYLLQYMILWNYIIQYN